MPIITKYSSLTTEEFLRNIEDKGGKSPIIQELIIRLEKEINGLGVSKDVDPHVECPVCEADLNVNYDHGNYLFALTVMNA